MYSHQQEQQQNSLYRSNQIYQQNQYSYQQNLSNNLSMTQTFQGIQDRNSSQNFQDFQQDQMTQQYFQYIEEQMQKLQFYNSCQLQYYRLEQIDLKLEHQQNDLTQEYTKQNKKKTKDFSCQTENEKQIDKINFKSQKVVTTKNQNIKIIEVELTEEQDFINLSDKCTMTENNEEQLYQTQVPQKNENKQNIESTLQDKNWKKYERYDQIKDNEDKVVLEFRRFELRIFSNNTVQQMIKNESFEQYYQFSLDLKKQKDNIPDYKFPFVRFNQQIGLRDKIILINQKMFVTSSIINAYATYLQAVDENYYFSLKGKERKKHSRLFIFRSDFITNCNIENYHYYDKNYEKKLIYLMLEYLQNFKVIQYQFWLIYKKIAFIVNSNNAHWYLAVLDYQDGQLKIYDSLPKPSIYYTQLNNLLSFLFSKLSQKNLKFQIFVCPTWTKQKDYYSCGYHTCLALEYLSQNEANTKPITQEEIKNILIQLLVKEGPEQFKSYQQ